VDYPVGEIQRDFIQRKIGVLNLLGEHDVAVAIAVFQPQYSCGPPLSRGLTREKHRDFSSL
jgi:hypothetical protein